MGPPTTSAQSNRRPHIQTTPTMVRNNNNRFLLLSPNFGAPGYHYEGRVHNGSRKNIPFGYHHSPFQNGPGKGRGRTDPPAQPLCTVPSHGCHRILESQGTNRRDGQQVAYGEFQGQSDAMLKVGSFFTWNHPGGVQHALIKIRWRNRSILGGRESDHYPKVCQMQKMHSPRINLE